MNKEDVEILKQRIEHIINKQKDYEQELKRIAYKVHFNKEPQNMEEEKIPYKKIIKEELDIDI